MQFKFIIVFFITYQQLLLQCSFLLLLFYCSFIKIVRAKPTYCHPLNQLSMHYSTSTYFYDDFQVESDEEDKTLDSRMRPRCIPIFQYSDSQRWKYVPRTRRSRFPLPQRYGRRRVHKNPAILMPFTQKNSSYADRVGDLPSSPFSNMGKQSDKIIDLDSDCLQQVDLQEQSQVGQRKLLLNGQKDMFWRQIDDQLDCQEHVILSQPTQLCPVNTMNTISQQSSRNTQSNSDLFNNQMSQTGGGMLKPEMSQIPAADQIRKSIRSLKRKFPQAKVSKLIGHLYEEVIVNNKSIESYMQTWQMYKADRQLLNLYLGDKKVETVCYYFQDLERERFLKRSNLIEQFSIETKGKTQQEVKSLETIQIVRTRLSYLMRQAMLKFNAQAFQLLNTFEYAKIELNNEKINKIIEAQSASANECRVALSKYYLSKSPQQKQFQELKKKLQFQLRSRYERGPISSIF